MRYSELIQEKYLHGETTFGFELEAYSLNSDRDKPEHVRNDIEYFIKKYFGPLESSIKDEQSIEAPIDTAVTFEWASNVLAFNPLNIKKVITFLSRLPDYEIYTNETCGFHVHVKFSSGTADSKSSIIPFSDKDRLWVLLNLSVDDQMQNMIKKFKSFDFFDDIKNPQDRDELAFAKTDFLNTLGDIVKNKDTEAEYLKDKEKLIYKYNVVGIHPLHGTLEWRGPRNFLNDNNIETIKQFFILLWKFTDWMATVLDKKELNGISRVEWTKHVDVLNLNPKLNRIYNHLKNNKSTINNIKDKNLLAMLFKFDYRLMSYYDNIPDDVAIKLCTQYPHIMDYVVTEEVGISSRAMKEILSINPTYIKMINNPWEELQLAAIKSDPYSIYYIKKPTENAKKVYAESTGKTYGNT